MKKIIALVMLSITGLICAEQTSDQPFSAVHALFSGMSNKNHKAMRQAVTDDFVLLEHGEVWSIDDLIDAVDPESKMVRTNYFSHINTDIHGDVALINYWNKANVASIRGNYDLIWLESVMAVKQDNQWKLSQMHSTRLDAGKQPANVTFKKHEHK